MFSWVARHYAEGWLTCDDSPGEIADFIHVDPGGVLSLIHVKAANSDSPARRVAAAAYEVVTSQAAKNLHFAERERLRDRLLSPPVSVPATWNEGSRAPNRDEFLDAFDSRNGTDPVQAVIVQPHLNEGTYRKIRSETTANGAPVTDAFLRLCLLETLLNTTRAAAIGLGADLHVIGSRQ